MNFSKAAVAFQKHTTEDVEFLPRIKTKELRISVIDSAHKTLRQTKNNKTSNSRDASIQLTQVAALQQAASATQHTQTESNFSDWFNEVFTGVVGPAMTLSAPPCTATRNSRRQLDSGILILALQWTRPDYFVLIRDAYFQSVETLDLRKALSV